MSVGLVTAVSFVQLLLCEENGRNVGQVKRDERLRF